MSRKRSVAALVMATALYGGLALAPLDAPAGLPAPLPVQIPIRDVSEPPSSIQSARPFTPSPARRTHRRATSARHKRHGAPNRTARTQNVPQTPTAQTGPKLEQRQEAPIESIMPLEPLPAPAPAPAKTPAASAKQPVQAEFPPAPEPAPKPAPAKP